jgi:hypothetical protein
MTAARREANELCRAARATIAKEGWYAADLSLRRCWRPGPVGVFVTIYTISASSRPGPPELALRSWR